MFFIGELNVKGKLIAVDRDFEIARPRESSLGTAPQDRELLPMFRCSPATDSEINLRTLRDVAENCLKTLRRRLRENVISSLHILQIHPDPFEIHVPLASGSPPNGNRLEIRE